MHRFLRRNVPLLALVSAEMRRRIGKPRPASFFNRAFLANRHTANAVASTRYLQSMHDGTLDPLSYGCLTVQDAYYCYHARDTMNALLDRIDCEAQPELFDLVKSKADSYDDYNRTFLEDWHIRNTDSVIPAETMRLYVEHERQVACDEEPIYSLAAFLPCYHLWPWFARQLMMSPRYKPGVYRDWFEGVYQGEIESFGGAWLMGNFIEEWKDAGNSFDEGLAHEIYRTSMSFEFGIFSEACGD